MSTPDIREDKISEVVEDLRELSENARERWLRRLDLSEAEKAAVRQRLYEAQPPPKVEPEELRKDLVFQRLVQDVRRGRALLFLGAGVSQEAGMPSSGALLDALVGLARSYRVDLPEPTEQSYTLPAVADRLERAGFRREMIETLKTRIEAAYHRDPPPHNQGIFPLLPELSQLNKVILTTNWDELVERTFLEAREAVTVIRRDRELALVPTARHSVVKLHGDFADPDMLIVSETDYVMARNAILKPGGLAGSLWGFMGALLGQYSVIFVGYRWADRDTQLVQTLVAIRQGHPETRHYMVGPFSDSERRALKDWANMEAIAAHAQAFFVALAQELAEFANREDDLDRIFRRDAAPFMEFFAPFGAGKRALLDEIERRAKAEGYSDEQIIRIDLKSFPESVTLAELIEGVAKSIGWPWIRRGEQLREALESKDRLLVLVENTEHLESNRKVLIEFVVSLVIPAIDTLNKRIAGKGLANRLIICGRYPVEGWPSTFRRRAEIFPLSPFTEDGVREMIRKFVRLRVRTAETVHPDPELVKQIYEITGGGRPSFVKAILKELTAGDQPVRLPRELTEREVQRFLSRFIEEIRREVWGNHVSTEFIALYEQCLCVLRRLCAALVARLAENASCAEHFTTSLPVDQIIAQLRRCHLLNYEYPLEVVDPLVRRIYARVLQQNHPDRFIAAHVAASTAWRQLLSTVTDLNQVVYVQEWLYHRISSMQLDSRNTEARWRDLKRELDQLEFKTQQRHEIRMGRLLVERIEERRERDRDRDGELLELLISCLGEDYYEALRQALLSKVEVVV